MDITITADQVFVRELNLSSVLQLIHNEAPLSRAQLAARTGLNKSTISSLVDDLMTRELIHETGMNSVGTGRPAIMLEINPRAGCIVGVQFGVDFVAAVLTDFVGNILWRKQTASDETESQEKTIQQVLDLTREAIAAADRLGHLLLGIGLALPGTVDIHQGNLVFAPNLRWHNVPLREIFSQSTGFEVRLENDANAAAVAEHLFGKARHCSDFIFVFAGVGIGGGLFLNGRLYRGKNGFAGEIGHSPILAGPEPVTCHCGNQGCWESYANQNSILERIQSRLSGNPNSVLPGLMAEHHLQLSIPLIKQAADIGDRQAREALSEAGEAMGQGFANLINIFNPEKIILGGPLSIAGRYLLPSIQETVHRHTLLDMDPQVDIELSAFGADASLIGATAIVVDDILSNPAHVERR